MINKKRLIRLTQTLIRINSENPGGNEYAIARFVKGYLEKIGLRTKIYEFKRRRSNVVATLGEKSGPSLLITPHLDTVPVGKSWTRPAFAGKIDRNRLYGLGATDCKCNVACSLEAIQSIVEDRIGLDYTLIFAATADEEAGSAWGLIPLLNKGILRAHAALVLDAEDFQIIVAQKGLLHVKVKLQGKKAHGAYPWRGVNAIQGAVEILKELQALPFGGREHRYLRPPTMNIGSIHGGDKVNVVADWCEFELDFRFLPGMSEKKILGDLKNIIRRHARKFKTEIEGVQKPYLIEESHSLVRGLTKAVEGCNMKPRIRGSEGATTITFFQDKYIPAVAFGFGTEGCAHTADEYVTVDNLYKGTLVLERFLKSYGS